MDVNNESAASCAAREYARRNWAPIPVPFKGKNPGDKRAGGYGSEWEDARIDESEVGQYWNGRPQNVGVILGEASDGLVDIDLDCAEAIALAPQFLYATPLAFGRKSKPKSHWLFRCAGELPKTIRFRMPPHGDNRGGATLVEFRANGGQTIFPGSVHESGEPIEWCGKSDAEPYEIDSEELLRNVHHLAAAAVLVRLWPSGSRHDAALALAGLMFQVGLPKDEANKIMHAVAEAAGDEERYDRVTCVESTYQKADQGEAVAGGGTLAGIIGDKAASKVRLWLGYGAAVRSNWLERESAAIAHSNRSIEPQAKTEASPKPPTAARGLEWVSSTLGFNISRVEKMVNEKPSYRLLTDRGEILLDNVHQLADFHSFKKQVAAHANHIISAKVRIIWDEVAQAMLDNRVDIAIGDDAGEIGSLKERVEEYCEKKKIIMLDAGETEFKKSRDEAIDFNQPWIEEGDLVFRGAAFLKFLKTEYFETMTPKVLGERIRRMGGDVGKVAYASSTRNVMKIPLTELSLQLG